MRLENSIGVVIQMCNAILSVCSNVELPNRLGEINGIPVDRDTMLDLQNIDDIDSLVLEIFI